MVEGYPDSLGRWGAPAIFKEAGRLIGKYFRLLHPFIAAFFLPLAVIQLLQIYALAWAFKHFPPPPHPGPGPHPHHHHHHHHHPHFVFGKYSLRDFYADSHKAMFVSEGDAFSPVPPPPPHPPLFPVLIAAAIGIIAWVLLSLAIASIAKVIAYIYSNEEDPAVTKSIFKSLPTSLYHLFITTLWILLISFLVVFIISVPFQVIHFFFKKINPQILFLINIVLVDLALLLLGFVFLLAPAVTVLEPENYGLASLRKGWNLVQSKVAAALIFYLVNLIVTGLLSKLSNLAVFLPIAKLPFWTVYIFGVVVAVLFLVISVYFLVAGIVLYFSSKLQSENDGQYLPVNSSEDNPYTPLVVPSEN